MRNVLGVVPVARRTQTESSRAGWETESGGSLRPLRGRARRKRKPLPHDAAQMAGGHDRGANDTGRPTRGDTGEREDGSGEGEGERGWDGGGMLACVVMAYGLVGAALADAPTPLHYNRHGHRRHRYRDTHERRYRYRYRDRRRRRERMRGRYRSAWRERDMYDARMGKKPKPRWHSSNITYLTQRLSWRVQGSGGGV